MSQYLTHKTQKEKENERKGMIISIVIHSLLLLLMLFYVIKPPEELPTQEGVLIDFGNSKTGKGDNNTNLEQIAEARQTQPEVQEEIVEETVPETSTPPPPTETATNPEVIDDAVTQNIEEAPSVTPDPQPTAEEIAEQKRKAEEARIQRELEEQRRIEEEKRRIEEEKKRLAEEERKRKEAEAQALKDQLDQAFKNSGNGSGQEGEGENTPGGNQGVLDGTPGAPHNDGNSSTGLGDSGIGYDLAGRKMIKSPDISDASQKVGKVAVKIRVDRNGNVISAQYTAKGSTTTDAYLIRKAEQAALKAKFNSNFNAKEVQFGTITFTFKVQ